MKTQYGKHKDVIPGRAWLRATIDDKGHKVGGSQCLIVSARDITRGKDKGRVEVIEPKFSGEALGRWKDGKKSIIDRASIIIFPHEREGGLI